MSTTGKIGLVIIVLVALICLTSIVSATGTNRIRMYGYDGYPGDIITDTITLTGSGDAARTGHWKVLYTPFEGDTEKMNLSSWITISPVNYTINPREEQIFTVTIKIPEDARAGLYGVNSSEAELKGHWYQRRQWIMFEDTSAEAAGKAVTAYSGFKIPVSVVVLGKPSIVDKLKYFIEDNKAVLSGLLAGVLLMVIVFGAQSLIRKRKKGGSKR